MTEPMTKHTYYVPDVQDIIQRLPIVPPERVAEWIESPFPIEYSVPIFLEPGGPKAKPYSDRAFALKVEDNRFDPMVPQGSCLLIDPGATLTESDDFVLVLTPVHRQPTLLRVNHSGQSTQSQELVIGVCKKVILSP